MKVIPGAEDARFSIFDEAFRADASYASHGVEAIATSRGRLRYGGRRT